jgi:saccharopine dehydrogenase-like NADP-dependent oxidoreductase
VQISDARKIYGQSLEGESWSAIQLTTAAAVSAVVDLYFDGKLSGTGLVRQEQVKLGDFLKNRFGQHYRGSKINSRYSGIPEITGAGHEEQVG